MEDAIAEALSADSTLATPLTRTAGKSQSPHVLSGDSYHICLWGICLLYSECSSTLSGPFLIWCEISIGVSV